LSYFYSDKTKNQVSTNLIALVFLGQQTQNYQFMMYDLEQQKPVYFKDDYFRTGYNKHTRDAHIYNFLNQLK
jgi:hypothetical protein